MRDKIATLIIYTDRSALLSIFGRAAGFVSIESLSVERAYAKIAAEDIELIFESRVEGVREVKS